MNHQLGCTSTWTPEARRQHFGRLQKPDGRHYMVGDQISYHAGWQEGALSSAHQALEQFGERARAELTG